MCVCVCVCVCTCVHTCFCVSVQYVEDVHMCTVNIVGSSIHTYINVVCCVGNFKGKTVHTFVMCLLYPDVRKHTSLNFDVVLWIIGKFPIHTSTKHCSTKGVPSKLIATAHSTYYIIAKVPLEKLYSGYRHLSLIDT